MKDVDGGKEDTMGASLELNVVIDLAIIEQPKDGPFYEEGKKTPSLPRVLLRSGTGGREDEVASD